MIFSHYMFSEQICFEEDLIQMLVLENNDNFGNMVMELYRQVHGSSGNYSVYVKDHELQLSKYSSLTINPFELSANTKQNINSLCAGISAIAHDEEHLLETNDLIAKIQSLMIEHSEVVDVDITYELDLDYVMLLKAMGIKFIESDSFEESVYNFIRLSRKFSDIRLFIFVNLSQYFANDRFCDLIRNFAYLQIPILLIEHNDVEIDCCKKIIDQDLCELNVKTRSRNVFEV